MTRLIAMSGFILLFVLGCATKYQPESFTGGFTEIQLSENIFKISFKGNGYTSREKVSDFALLRSAEIALARGYNYFIIIDSEKYIENINYTSPIRHNTTFNTNTGNAYITTSGGDSYNFSKPSTSNTILCFQEKPQVNTVVYEAKFLVNSIKSKYTINN